MSTDQTLLSIAGLVACAGVLLALGLFVRRRRRVAGAFGDADLLARLTGEDLRRAPWRRLLLVGLAAVFLGAALLDPRWGEPEGDPVAGGTVVLVLDASSSMLARDLEPNRLERQREAARRLARRLEGSAIGIVVFAGRAYALSPPTTDPGGVELYLEALDPGMVTQTGSSLAPAIRQGLAMLLGARAAAGLVLITDGDTEGADAALDEALDIAARAGMPVFTLGAATPEGAPVPAVDFQTGAVTGYLEDAAGEPIVSSLGERALERIAERTGGMYRRLAEPGAVEAVAQALERGAGRGTGTTPGAGTRPPARFAWFAAAALLLLVLELLPAGRPGRRPAALAIVVIAGAAACAGDDPRARFEAGDYEGAVEGYRRMLTRAPGSPTVHYNLGAATLRLGEFEAARPHLEIAARSRPDTLRQWGYYNIGNTHLEPAHAGSIEEGVAAELARAIVAYKRALLIDPEDIDAKWNLELARRLLEQERRRPPMPLGGGGGGGGGGGDEGTGRQDPRPRSGAAGGESPRLTAAEAEALLDAAERREAGLQQEKLRKSQPPVVSH